VLLDENIIYGKAIKYNVLKFINRIVIFYHFIYIYFILNLERITSKVVYRLSFGILTFFFIISIEFYIFLIVYKFMNKDINLIKFNFVKEGKNIFWYSLLLFFIYLYFLSTNFNKVVELKYFTIIYIILFVLYIYNNIIIFKLSEDLSLYFEEYDNIEKKKAQSIEINKNLIDKKNIERAKKIKIICTISILIYIFIYLFFIMMIVDFKKNQLLNLQVIVTFTIICFMFVVTYIYKLINMFKLKKEKKIVISKNILT